MKTLRAKRGQLALTVLWLGLAGGAALLFMSQTFLPSLSRQTHGFAAYYTGAWLLQHGRQAELYDSVLFNAALQGSGIVGIYDIYDANAPLLALATWPLALWPPMTARAVWLWCNLALLIGLIGLARRLLPGLSSTLIGLGFCATALLLYGPLNENFRLGQMYLPFLTAALISLVVSNEAVGAVGLGLELIFKLYYGVFGLVIGLTRPRPVLLGVGLTGVAVVVGGWWFGPASWLAYLRLAGSFGQRPYIGVTAYQTLSGFFSHLLRYDAQWNPQPVAAWPLLAGLLPSLITAGLLLISGRAVWRAGRGAAKGWQLNREATRLTVGLAFCLAPILAPAAEEYHYTLLLLPLFVSLGSWLTTRPRAWLVALGWTAAVVLLGPPWTYKTWPTAGWAALLSYPRLYGALILWAVLTIQLTKLNPKREAYAG